MYVAFDNLPKTSRVWIYQANRSLSSAEIDAIESKLNNFVDHWKAHQQNLKGSYQLVKERFIVLALDESFNQASGCSIDASVHCLKELEQALNLNFFERTLLCKNKNNSIEEVNFSTISDAVSSGKIQKDTIIYDNLVNTIEKFESSWEVEAQNTWLSRYFS